MSYWRWWGKGQSPGAELLPVEEAVLDAESTVCVAAASLKRWELSDVGGQESLQLLRNCYNYCDRWSPSWCWTAVCEDFLWFPRVSTIHCHLLRLKRMRGGNSLLFFFLLLFLLFHMSVCRLIPIFLSRLVFTPEEFNPALSEIRWLSYQWLLWHSVVGFSLGGREKAEQSRTQSWCAPKPTKIVAVFLSAVFDFWSYPKTTESII